MIKVIKNGYLNPKTKLVFMVTCKKCNCIFSCESSDFKQQMGSGSTLSAIVDCPYCGEAIYVDDTTPSKTELEEDTNE